jgi:hypothetical protein
MIRNSLLSIAVTLCSGVAFADHFAVDQMPVGAEVTVPPAAKTIVPMGARVKLSSTDNPQTLRIVPIGNGETFAAPIKLAIFDSNQERVKYIRVTPGAPFLYSFKGLSTITIQPSLQKTSGDAPGGVRMQIESDKAVTVAR